jgi:hypothetical protein
VVVGQLRALAGHLTAHPELAGDVFNVRPATAFNKARLCGVSVYALPSAAVTVQAWWQSFPAGATLSVCRTNQWVLVTMCSGVLAVEFGLDEDESWAAAMTFHLKKEDQPRAVTLAELLACLRSVDSSGGETSS